MASALISIRGGHWPKPAGLLPDWLRGRQPGLIFHRGPRLARSRRGVGCGWGCGRPGACLGEGEVPQLRLPSASRVGEGTPSGPFLSTPPLPAALSKQFSPLRGAGPGALRKTCPGWPRGGKDGAHTSSRDSPSPSGSPGDSSPPTRGPLAQAPRLRGPFTRKVPSGLWAPAGWALPLTEASLSTLGLAPPLVPGDNLAFPA